MRYLQDLRAAYCPAWTPPYYQHDDATFGFAPDPAAAGGHGEHVAWSYHYRSAMDSDDGAPRAPRLTEDDAADPFLADAFTPVPGEALGDGDDAHPARDLAHRTGFNVAYLDGSVTYLTDHNNVVTDHAPDGNEHEAQEAEVWEPYFEKESNFFLAGPAGGTIATHDEDGDE